MQVAGFVVSLDLLCECNCVGIARPLKQLEEKWWEKHCCVIEVFP